MRPPGAALGAPPSQIIPSGFCDALSLLSNGRAPTWNFAGQLQLSDRHEPGGSRNRRAPACSSGRRSRRAGSSSCRSRPRSPTRRCSSTSNRERLQAATAARELAELRLEAEQSRFEVGLSTNFFVVQAQRDLRDAQNAELRALLDYRRAQVEFERVQEIPVGRRAVGITPYPAGRRNGASRANAGGGGGGGGGN